MLSEEEDILLDSPTLEVSDSESDEALLAGSEGRGSEAGMWGGDLVGDADWEWGERMQEQELPKQLLILPKEVSRSMLLVACVTLVKDICLSVPLFPLCTKTQ